MNLDTFDPAAALQALIEHGVEFIVIGGYAAVLYGSPLFTADADVCPNTDPANLARLCDALRALDARLRTATEPEGVPFRCDEHFLETMRVVNLVTRFGDLDLAFQPAAVGGYDDLIGAAADFDIGGVVVKVADLDDIIRSKEAVNRDKDRLGLVHLYALRDELAARETPPTRRRRPKEKK